MTRIQRRRLIGDTILLGIAGALAARAFVWLLEFSLGLFLGRIAGYTPPGLASEYNLARESIGRFGLWLVPLSTVAGGLITGLLVYGLAPEAEGHGTDAVVNAFHRTMGMIRARVPFVKLFASAITIGSGGAAGREGPIALITSGVASVYSVRLRRSEEEVRLLVLVGMAAGLSAIFRSPIGTAVFAIEVLYSEMEFEGSALFYTMLGSLVAYAVTGLFVGLRPLFDFPANLHTPSVSTYGWYVLLGATSGVVATGMPMALYTVRDAFGGLRIPNYLKPALGGLGVGLLALVFPQVLAGGYGWIQQAIDGRLTTAVLFGLAFAKLIAFSLTIGSGGSGGIFAPSLYVGAMLGGGLAQLVHQPVAAFSAVGMAAVFAGAARVPIATLLMVAEMTADYKMLVPAALTVMVSHFVQASLSRPLKYRSLYEAQVPTRADSPAHHAEQLDIAFGLLSRHPGILRLPGALELTSLLTSGVPIGLPDGKQIRIGRLRRQSPCAGRQIRSCRLNSPPGESEIVLALRGTELLWPSADVPLQAGDRLLVVTSNEAWDSICQRDLDPLPAGPRV